MDDKSTLPVLVADIGGTHARFALAASNREGHPVLTSVRFAITHPQPGLLGAGAWATAVN